MDRVASLGCLVCGAPATVHHVTSDGYQRCARSHRRVAPLCPRHHLKVFDPKAADPISVEGLGHAGFRDRYGIDMMVWALDAWRYRGEPEHEFWHDRLVLMRAIARARI